MLKTKIFVIFFSALVTLSTSAHEGMWIPALLKAINEPEMKTLGLKLSAEDIYSVNQSSLKDAIVHFGGFCTGEIISDKGLVLTNHHCGYGAIQSHSSLEKDYLKNGFWAKNQLEELANPSLFATFIVSIEDVTEEILGNTRELENPEPVVRRNIAELTKKANASGEGEAFIRAFYYGNQYFIIRTKTYNDVRLVGAPPSAVGKFGGDTDNWVWPRHTGDFSLFRIYADANNEPAAFNADNVPFKPKKHLPISLQGSDDGEFAMVYGFPGSTDHFLCSTEVEQVISEINPMRIKMRDASLAVIDAAMASSDLTRIQYAAKQSSISNAWKKWRGQTRGLKMFNAVQKKKAFEAEYIARSKKENKPQYAVALNNLMEFQAEQVEITKARANFIELVYVGSELFKYAFSYEKLMSLYQSDANDSTLTAEKKKILKSIDKHFKDYDKEIDQEVLLAQLPLYIKNAKSEYIVDWAKELETKEAQEKWAAKLFSKTLFTKKKELIQILESGGGNGLKKLKKDPAYEAMKALYANYYKAIAPKYQVNNAKKEQLMKFYVDGILTLFPEIGHWPDANSTLRLSYGKVEGSEPLDGVQYLPQTSAMGLLDKYLPGDREFDLPEKLVELIENKDYGQYASADGSLVVCFTSSNHTSGGNSGSPVINGKGHLIGLNFDRSWESTMSDIMFEPSICRNIAVDIRYVLFIMDKYAEANHLIDELELVSSNSN